MPEPHKTARAPLALALALALGAAQPAQAQALLHEARSMWERLSTGQSPRSVPLAASGAVQVWGASPAEPARDAWSVERLRDERERDERGRDERGRDARTPTAAPARSTARSNPAPAARPESAPSPEPRRYYVDGPRNAGQRAVRAQADCTSIERAWEAAERLARSGDTARAYDAYRRLLSSCRLADELAGTAQRATQFLPEAKLERLLAEPAMASPQLAQAAYIVQRQRMYGAHERGEAKAALALARAIRKDVLASRDETALQVSGWLEQAAGEPKAAEALFRAALAAQRDSEPAREGLVFALLAQNKLSAAAAEAQRLDGANASGVRAEVLFAQAREHLKHGRFEAALAALDEAEAFGLPASDGVLQVRAWALHGAHRPAEALPLFRALAEAAPLDAAVQDGLVQTLAALGEDAELERLIEAGGLVGARARQARALRLSERGRRIEAAQLLGEKVEGGAGAVNTTVGLRSKSGDAGEGRLTEASASASAALALGKASRIELDAAALRLADGRASVRGQELRARVRTEFGAMQFTAGAGASRANEDTRATFEARARVNLQAGHVEAGITREPVRDSVRSYAGKGITVADDSGALMPRRVGRALDTQAYVAASYALDAAQRWRLDGSLAAGSVTGTNLAANSYYRAQGALTRQLAHPAYSWLELGPYLSLQAYERDENRFDGAYGGYFSPRSDVNIGVLGNALTREGGVSLYKAGAKLGFVSRGLHYGNDSGAALETGAEALWLLGRHLAVGAALQLRTSPGYTDVAARVGVQIPLEPRTKLYASDLPGMRGGQ